MSSPRRSLTLLTVLPLLVAVGGCMSWTPGWEGSPLSSGSASAGESAPSSALARAEALFENAGDAPQLQQAIREYEALLPSAADPGAVLARLSEAHILFGAAYADGKNAKAGAYTTGIRYAERAMACLLYTSPSPRDRTRSRMPSSA